ncbi:hypothetical protein GCM10023084_38950 [Streptomyces lacrimifluminis]|uniref:Uncharacterized protein n=1 Tax=Streptomyces lacrimifluminis TaxID=1500077 RepID=A0A917L111_9ACTN|nr:hypothetical protein GCM10012282_40570 [Streptomyces lacrimifluminis]
MSFTVTVLPPANGVLREDAEGYVDAAGGWVSDVPSVRRVVLRQRVVAREVACDAGGRARKHVGLRGQPTYAWSLHAGRPDTFKV